MHPMIKLKLIFTAFFFGSGFILLLISYFLKSAVARNFGIIMLVGGVIWLAQIIDLIIYLRKQRKNKK